MQKWGYFKSLYIAEATSFFNNPKKHVFFSELVGHIDLFNKSQSFFIMVILMIIVEKPKRQLSKNQLLRYEKYLVPNIAPKPYI